MHRPVDRLGQFLLGHNLDVPAGELARQPDVLPATTYRERQLVLAHQHDRPAQHLAEDHLFDLGWLQSVGDQQLQVIVPANDVDSFAAQLVDNILDPVAAHADAGAHTVDPLIAAADRHLGSVAGLAAHRADFDHTVDDLGNLLLEQPLHQLGSGAAEYHFHAAAALADLVHGGSHPLVDVVGFAGDLFATGQDCFDVGKRHRCRTAFVALHHAADHLADQLGIFVVQGVSFRLADFLDHHLFGGLSADSTDRLFGVEGFSVTGGGNFAALAVDSNKDFRFFSIMFLGGRNQRGLDAFEYDLLGDVFVAVNRIHDSQYFSRVHNESFHGVFRPPRGKPNCSNCSNCRFGDRPGSRSPAAASRRMLANHSLGD